MKLLKSESKFALLSRFRLSGERRRFRVSLIGRTPSFQSSAYRKNAVVSEFRLSEERRRFRVSLIGRTPSFQSSAYRKNAVVSEFRVSEERRRFRVSRIGRTTSFQSFAYRKNAVVSELRLSGVRWCFGYFNGSLAVKFRTFRQSDRVGFPKILLHSSLQVSTLNFCFPIHSFVVICFGFSKFIYIVYTGSVVCLECL